MLGWRIVSYIFKASFRALTVIAVGCAGLNRQVLDRSRYLVSEDRGWKQLNVSTTTRLVSRPVLKSKA